MKNIIRTILFFCVASFWGACTNDDVVVRYAPSTPQIDTAWVKETQITYGDSIHFKIAVSDKNTPLSTLKVRVVCNGEVINTETVRTKGNAFSMNRVVAIPFGPNRPDNQAIEVYITETNVSNIKKDSIVATTIAKRPLNKDANGNPITTTKYYIVPDFGQGNTAELLPIDAANLVYKATGLLYKKTLSFKIATKITSFKRVDWSGMVWGKVGDGIGLIDSVKASEKSISVTGDALVGISEFTFDALQFTYKIGGKLLEPVKTLDIMADLADKPASLNSPNGFRGGNVYFGEGVEVTFSGVTNLASNISPDYFEVTGTNTAKFLGKTGLYKAYFMTSAGYLYIEPQPDAIYPDVLWVCGSGFSRPQAPYTANQSPWNWNSPIDYAPARLVSSGVYQVTMYCKNEPVYNDKNVLQKYGKLDFKFFHKRGWWDGHETWAGKDFTTLTPPFFGPSDGNGNVKLLPDSPVDGVYRFTLDLNAKTLTAVKLN